MTTASFRIEIIPKPIYVGGLGPPMAPISMLPEHDEESWVIAQLIQYGKEPHYVVHPKDKPVVRKIVQKNEILNWVSPRVLEAFELEEETRRDAREEELKQKRELNKLTRNGKKRGRPFKRAQTGASASLVESIETETDTPEDSADPLASSYPPQPSNTQPSLSQPSLSQPHLTLRHRMDSPFDTENTEDDEGITGSMEPPPSKRSRTDMSEGLSSKIPINPKESVSSPQTVQNPAPTFKQPQRSKSMAEPSTPQRTPSPSKTRTPQRSTAPPVSTSNSGRSLRDRSAQPFYGRQRSQTAYPSHSASPAKSRKSTTPLGYPTRSSSRSRNATPSGDLQKPADKGWKSAPSKPTASSPQKRSKATTPSKSKPAPPAAESDDDDDADDKEQEMMDGKQWKVIRLLDDKYRMIKRRRCHYYLTQWAGDYAPTWERSTNITNDLKIEYEAWKKTPEGKARKEKGGKASIEKDTEPPQNAADRPASRNSADETEEDVAPPRSSDDRPHSSSSADDQAQASKQLGTDIGVLSTPDDDDVDMVVPVPVKQERVEESLDELPLARSPYFPEQPAAGAVESGDEE
ncbi:hypothetical protein V500_09554 [Pseudogymnoascus sp. VKM F-4518 (FW-2643)]|nr:hypothetical protein V500_09554 [Pseudogymnoascus sp. VKM F-4518 (FW-2643)]